MDPAIVYLLMSTRLIANGKKLTKVGRRLQGKMTGGGERTGRKKVAIGDNQQPFAIFDAPLLVAGRAMSWPDPVALGPRHGYGH